MKADVAAYLYKKELSGEASSDSDEDSMFGSFNPNLNTNICELSN